MKLCCIVTEIGTRIRLYTPYQCTKFQQDQSTCLRVRVDFVICAKRRRKKKRRTKTNFCLSYLGNTWRDFLQFWNPASPYRRQFHSKFGDLWVKGHGSMNAWKYTHSRLRAPMASWAARRTTVCLDTAANCSEEMWFLHCWYWETLEHFKLLQPKDHYVCKGVWRYLGVAIRQRCMKLPLKCVPL